LESHDLDGSNPNFDLWNLTLDPPKSPDIVPDRSQNLLMMPHSASESRESEEDDDDGAD
jgi:hypothetical protein